MGVQCGVRRLPQLFIHMRKFHGGLEYARTRHQDHIMPLLPERKRLPRLGEGFIDLAAFQVQVSGVDQHGARATLMLVQCIDIAGLAEQLERLAQNQQVLGVNGSANVIALPLGLHVERDKTFYVGSVDQRTSKIWVIGVGFRVNRDGALEVLKSESIVARTADKAASCRLDVSEREGVTGDAELGFGLVEKVQRVAALAFLKHQPAFVDLCNGYQLGSVGILGRRSRCGDME